MKPCESCYGVSMVRMKSQWYTLFSSPLPLLKYLRPFNSTTCFMGFTSISSGFSSILHASGDQPCPGNITCTVRCSKTFVLKISGFSFENGLVLGNEVLKLKHIITH